MMIALKVFRRCYRREGLTESAIHHHLGSAGGGLVPLFGAFEHEGRLCIAYGRHGHSLERQLEDGPIPADLVRTASVSLLTTLRSIHEVGFVHTDIKAGNILYDPANGLVRLADLGSARTNLPQGTLLGSREYTAPEVLVGAPLSPAIDLWGLGCCLFEMLTGRLLFDPREAAEKKYLEFDPEDGVPPGPRATADEEKEKSEQLAAGSELGGRYRITEVLGQGRYATVWAAEPLESERPGERRQAPLLQPSPLSPRRRANETSRAARDKEERWQKTKGADDILDLVLNYEHAILISRLCGPFPPSLLGSAKYRDSYFENDGELRFRPVIRRDSLRSRLRRQTSLTGKDLEGAADFLGRLLVPDPTDRLDAAGALAHPWLSERPLTKALDPLPSATDGKTRRKINQLT